MTKRFKMPQGWFPLLKEAMAREEMLHQKINSLQAFIEEAKETSENGWLVSHDYH